jgi:hypothetical protein
MRSHVWYAGNSKKKQKLKKTEREKKKERGVAVIEWAIDRCIFDESGWWFALRLAASAGLLKRERVRERERVCRAIGREKGGCCHRETHRSSPCHRLISGLISCLSHVCNWIAPIHHQHRDIFPFSFFFEKKRKKRLSRSFVYSFVFDCLDPPSASLSLATQADTLWFFHFIRFVSSSSSSSFNDFSLPIYLSIHLSNLSMWRRHWSSAFFFLLQTFSFHLIFFVLFSSFNRPAKNDYTRKTLQGRHRLEIAPEKEEECSSWPCLVRASCSIISAESRKEDERKKEKKERGDIYSTLGPFDSFIIAQLLR